MITALHIDHTTSRTLAVPVTGRSARSNSYRRMPCGAGQFTADERLRGTRAGPAPCYRAGAGSDREVR